MNIKKFLNKKIFLSFFSLSLCFVCVGFFSNGSSRYNKNPDLSKKIVGSEGDRYSIAHLKSFDQVVYFSDLIIKGQVIGDSIQESKRLEYVLETDKIEQLPEIPVSLVKIKVNEIIKGNIDGEEILLLQEGLVNDDTSLETKVKKDDNYIFFLIKDKFEDQDVYIAYRKEVGLMKMNNKNKSFLTKGIDNKNDKSTTFSLSKEEELAKYDDIDVQIIEEDIISSLDKTQDISVEDAYDLYYNLELNY